MSLNPFWLLRKIFMRRTLLPKVILIPILRRWQFERHQFPNRGVRPNLWRCICQFTSRPCQNKLQYVKFCVIHNIVLLCLKVKTRTRIFWNRWNSCFWANLVRDTPWVENYEIWRRRSTDHLIGGNPPIIRTMRSASQVISICPFCRTYDAYYVNVWGTDSKVSNLNARHFMPNPCVPLKHH